MKSVKEIYCEFLLGKVKFHRREETEIFDDALKLYVDKKFSASAVLCAVLYERIFTTRFINETANPSGLVPSKDNIQEQLNNLRNRESEVINRDRLRFSAITEKLTGLGILTEEEKAEHDQFYKVVRNPVVHGLTSRLFERVMGNPPGNPFETDTNYEKTYCNVAHELIYKIYYLIPIRLIIDL